MLAVTVTSRDQCLAVVCWLAVGGCRRRYHHLPSPAVAAASRHRYHRYRICAGNSFTPSAVVMMVKQWTKGRRFDSEPKQYIPGFRGTVGESRRKILLTSWRLLAGLRQLLAKHTQALLGMQSTVWGNSHMLPSRGVRVWVVYLTPKLERVISLLSPPQWVRRGADAVRYGLQGLIIIIII
jgi:hypothetical protein